MAVQFEPDEAGAFDYAQKIKVECSQSGFSNIWIPPQNGTTNQAGPFIFDIDPSVDKYIMLKKVKLEMDCRVLKENGDELGFEDVVAPCDLTGACFWENVEVFLNGQPFSGASSVNAGYKAFLETMLTYDADSAASHLQSQFFYQDTPGQYDNFSASERLVKEYFYHLCQHGKIETDVPLKYQAGKHEEAELVADENARRAKRNEDPRPATWKPPAFSEEEKTEQRLAIYNAKWAELAQEGLTAILAGEGDAVNVGFDARAKVVRGSERFDMYSPICHDFFRINNNLGPGNRLQLKLTRHRNPFLLNTYLTTHNYQIRIDEMKLHLHYVQRRERIRPPLREIYRMNETQVHKQLVNKSAPSITFRVQNGGVLPKSIVFALVSVRQAEGAYNTNPFHFHHYFLKNISLNINGESYPGNGLEADFERPNPKIARLFHWGFDNTGASDAQKGNLVSWAAFMSGCTVIPFNLDFDLCNMKHLHTAQYGYIDCTIEFHIPLNEPIYVLYEKIYTKAVVNDKLTNTLTVLDIEA